MESLEITYSHNPFEYPEYPHIVKLRVIFDRLGSEETIVTVVRGHRYLGQKLKEAETWLYQQGFDYKLTMKPNSSTRDLYFKTKTDAMMFKLGWV